LRYRGRGGRDRPHRPGSDVQRVAFDPNHLPDEEAELLQDAQLGDRRAFAALIERYWERLYRWLYHLTRDVHAAEDLAQESFLKAYAALKSFRLGSNFRAWLYRIAHNNFINHRRAGRRVRSALPEEVLAPPGGPVEDALGRELLERLGQAVGKLPAEFRAALMLRAEEGLSFRQIAEVLGTTEETARWRVFKARQKLMQLMAPELGVRDPEASGGR
ncbi:MAG TPA: sigma-70 family RNA polymerase sigma factor, partial [Gemmataceae bacterium]